MKHVIGLRYRAANKGKVDVVHLFIEWGTEVDSHDVDVALLYSYTLTGHAWNEKQLTRQDMACKFAESRSPYRV